jgi:hypothetical protein
MIAVVAPAGLVGYWARKDDASELSRLQYVGYSIVREADLKKPLWTANGIQPDGTYVIGDVILMSIDAELDEFLKSENSLQAQQLMEGAAEGFKEDASRQGVPTFDVSKPKGR